MSLNLKLKVPTSSLMSRRVGIALIPLLSWTAQAQTMQAEKRGLMRKPTQIGAQVGIVNVEGVDDAVLSYGANGEYALSPQFGVGGSLNFWNKSTGDVGEVKYDVNDIAVGAHGRFVFTDFEHVAVKPFVLGGLALHRVEVKKQRRDDSDTKIDKFRSSDVNASGELGVDLAGGALYEIQENLDVLGEIRWRNLLDSGVGFDQLAFTGGLNYKL